MLTDKEVDHIAKLARIELDSDRTEHLKRDLSSILGYIEKLNEVDTAGVEPLYQVTGLTNQTRADDYRGDFVMDEKLTRLLIGQAPAHRERLLKVKAVKRVTSNE